MIFLIYREKRKKWAFGQPPSQASLTSVPAPCRELGI
nr:MAG TPA: hypothetical protein [Caudoviricetes sp.]